MRKWTLIFAVMLLGTMAAYSKEINTDIIKAYALPGEKAFTRHSNMSDTVTMVIINDAFVTQVLSRDMTIPNILRAYHRINTYVKLIPNKYKAKVKDTIVNFTKGKTTYSFFKASSGNTLISANIESNTISTAGIAVGATKEKFEKIVAVPHVSDVVIIEDKEKTHRFIYTFKGEKLANIAYESPYHDY